MSHFTDTTAIALETKLAEFERNPTSDPYERIHTRIALLEIYEDSKRSLQALTFAEETYALALQFNFVTDPTIMLPCLAYLSSLCERLGQPDRALQYGLEGLAYIDMEHPTSIMGHVFIALGSTYTDLGKFDDALHYNQQALDLAITHQFLKIQGRAYTNLGYLYDAWSKPEIALEAYQKALCPEIYNTFLHQGRAILHNNIATAHMALNEPKEALIQAEQAAQIYELPIVMCTLGEALTMNQVYERASEVLKRALELADQEQDRFAACATLLAQGDLYYRQDWIEAAIAAFEQALIVADTHKGRQSLCLQQLTQLYESQGYARDAFITFHRYLKVREELALERADQQVRVLEVEAHNTLARQAAKLAQQEQVLLAERNAQLEQLVFERDQALEEQNRLVHTQQALVATIAELSTPVLPLLPGVLVLPIVGVLDSRRLAQMTETLLNGISKEAAQVVILDITGVPMVDTQVASSIVSLSQAVKLLGCHVIMVGIRPEIAQTLVGLGVYLGGITTYATLAEGLTRALSMVGLGLAQK